MNYDEAGDALNTLLWPTFKAQAQAILGYVPTVYWPDKAEDATPPADKFWMRITRRNVSDRLEGFGEGNANKAARYTTFELYYIQMFYPMGDKNSTLNFSKLASIAKECFRGKHDPTNTLWCRDVSIKPLDSEKTWFRKNIVVELNYQDIPE